MPIKWFDVNFVPCAETLRWLQANNKLTHASKHKGAELSTVGANLINGTLGDLIVEASARMSQQQNIKAIIEPTIDYVDKLNGLCNAVLTLNLNQADVVYPIVETIIDMIENLQADISDELDAIND